MRQLWPAVPFVALLAVAYFQATGCVALVVAEVAEPTQATDLAPARDAPVAPPSLDASPILARNPFDSETGPLGRFAPEQPVASASTASVPADPMAVKTCEFAYVTLITASEDPAWSFAAVELKGGESVLRRVGSAVDGHTVEHISWNRVWLADESDLCQLKLGDKPEVKKRKRRPSRKRRARRGRRSTRLPAHIKSKIKKVGAHEYDVERSAIDEILEDQARLFRATRVRPVREGGKTTGIRLSRIRGGTLLNTLGLRNGDVFKSVNGFGVTDPQRALEAYGRLRTADHLTLSLERKGKPLTIDVNIK